MRSTERLYWGFWGCIGSRFNSWSQILKYQLLSSGAMKKLISHEDFDVYMITEKDSPKSAASVDARLMSFGIMDTYGNDRRLVYCVSIYDMGGF